MERRTRSERRSDLTASNDRRNEDRNTEQRRQYFRVVYPPSAEPQVLNAKFHIKNISLNGIQLACRENCKYCAHPISLKSIVDLLIQFHDGGMATVTIEILRCERSLFSLEKTYAGFVRQGLTNERIAKEQAYLLHHFPDYCRSSQE